MAVSWSTMMALLANARPKTVTDTRSKPFFQFSLRSLLVGVFVCAICIFSWRLLLELSFTYFHLSAALLAIAAWWIGQRMHARAIDHDRTRIRFSLPRVGLPIAFLACLLSLWLRHRWVVWPQDDAWPRPFPYPDELMMMFHEWLDSKYPAPPGMLKIHGEFYTVLIGLNLAALCLCTVLGALLGCVSRTTGPIGITYWHDKIMTVYRRLT